MRVALIQIETVLDRTPRHTRLRAAGQIADAADDGPGSQLVVLPELWAHGAFDPGPWPDLAEPVDGEIGTTMSGAARANYVVLHAGSIVERAADGGYYNTSLVYGPEGESLATYRKIHRFGFDKGEAAFMAPGTGLTTFELRDSITGRPVTTVGLATCYDLRFPELFRGLVDAGAKMVIVPAAWPARRREHWRTLLRARAIENQVFVLACAAVGTQADLEMSGHSMVIDPWGEVVAEGGEEEETVFADIDPAYVDETRERFPVLRDRRL